MSEKITKRSLLMKYNSLNLKVKTTNKKYLLNDTKLFVRLAYIITIEMETELKIIM